MAAVIHALSEKERREFHDLVFALKRSVRYHNHRRRFFDWFDKSVKVLSLVTGSAAFAAAVATHHAATVAFAALVATLSAINLVVSPAQAARLHEELARRFAKLELAIQQAGAVSPNKLNEFIAERLLIESDEPPVYRVLDTICHNELCRAQGYDECQLYDVGPVQSFLANFVDLRPSKIRRSG
jgi:hypothetical protein